MFTTFIFLCWAMADGKQPYVMILGTAQDGGLPQIGCQGPHCQKALQENSARRTITSLLIVHPKTGQRWLVEATPDIRHQVAYIDSQIPPRKASQGRPPLFDGIFVTHAHIGHYTGLAFLGREAYNHPEIPLYGSARLLNFLQTNGPWQLLFTNGNLRANPLTPKQRFDLTDDLAVTAFHVPHRDEFSDTFGFIIHGPNRDILFIPDIDKWSRWDEKIEHYIAQVDVALLDGTFFAAGEIPGRAMAEIPHPFIVESLHRFQDLPLHEKQKIAFIHINHTNPILNPKSNPAAQVRDAGMIVSVDGQIINL